MIVIIMKLLPYSHFSKHFVRSHLVDTCAIHSIEVSTTTGLMDINAKRKEMADLRDKMIKYGISTSPEPISGKPLLSELHSSRLQEEKAIDAVLRNTSILEERMRNELNYQVADQILHENRQLRQKEARYELLRKLGEGMLVVSTAAAVLGGVAFYTK
mmetsp:Transcript_34503/g.48051  ORF Transcript_34503/g.48051 Transcript_34503/m.48051 type:complete len:158 (-) Transcript_34503:168-641(-)